MGWWDDTQKQPLVYGEHNQYSECMGGYIYIYICIYIYTIYRYILVDMIEYVN